MPTKEHWTAVKRILQYPNGTLNYGLVYEKNIDGLIGYSHADWAGDTNDQRSTFGYSFMMAGSSCRKLEKQKSDLRGSLHSRGRVCCDCCSNTRSYLNEMVVGTALP